jgi:hypothetical protein
MAPGLSQEECEGEALSVLRRHDMLRLPVDPHSIAALNDIAMEARALEGIAGCLMHVGGAFGIVYSTSIPSDGFMRFSLAHELGHYFLPGHPQTLFGDGATVHFSQAGFVSNSRVEREADNFAAGLLMPEAPFRAALRNAGTGFRAVERLSSDCGTSLTSTAIRYARFSDDPVAVVVSERGRVAYGFLSTSMRGVRGVGRLERGASIPETCPTTSMWNESNKLGPGARSEGTSNLSDWFEDAPDVEVAEDSVWLGTYGKCLTVLSLDEVPDDDQEGADNDEDD